MPGFTVLMFVLRSDELKNECFLNGYS